MIAQSQRPLLMCGGGVVRGRADRQFREFAEKLDCPVAITVMGAAASRCAPPHHRHGGDARHPGLQHRL